MTTLDQIRFTHERIDLSSKSRRSSHHTLDCDWLEPRELLSAVQATTSSTTTAPAAISLVPNATAGETTVGPIGTGGTDQTTGIGQIQFIQSSLPVTGLLANLQDVDTTVYETPGPISVGTGLLSLPLGPILPPSVTANENPLNNGTPFLGTVWITPAPEPPGVFHPNMTASAVAASTILQSVNPQNMPYSFMQFGGVGNHFGQGNGTTSGVTVSEQPIAVGPVGTPAMMDQVEPAQAPSQADQQTTGQPTQQQGTPSQQNGAAPGQQNAQPSQNSGGSGQQGGAPSQQGGSPAQPGTSQGQQGAGGGGAGTISSQANGTPGGTAGGQQGGASGQQGGVSGQQGGASGQQGGASGQSGTQGSSASQQQGQGGMPSKGGGAGGSTGGSSGSASGPSAFLNPTDPDQARRQLAASIELIDAALPSVASSPTDESAEDAQANCGLASAFGAAVLASGGYQIALRVSGRMRGDWVLGPRNARGGSGRRYGSPSHN